MTAAVLQPDPSIERAASPPPLLRVERLAVSFDSPAGPRRAVDGVSFTARAGRTLAIVGESGSGKSVTAMSLLRLLPNPPARVEAGHAWFDSGAGRCNLLSLGDREMRRVRGGQIAMIFQEPMTSLNPVFTIGEQIAEAVRLHQGLTGRQAVDVAAAALREVEIDDPAKRLRQYPHEFSGGMRQRVMIAMALACRPRLLIADEPTTALDVTIQAQILSLLDRLCTERGMGIILITHALGIVARHADTACVIYRGRVVESAGVAELFAHPLHPYTRGLLACVPSIKGTKERLATIREYTDSAAAFAPIATQVGSAPPWWPDHRPDDVVPQHGSPSDSVLAPAKAGHWVRVWRTAEVVSAADQVPDMVV